MSDLLIPRNAWVFVGDGRKALFPRNQGDAFRPNPTVESVLVDDNPPDPRAGQRPARSGIFERRKNTKQRGADRLARHRGAPVRPQGGANARGGGRSNKVKKLFVVAPARTLVDLRAVMHEDVRKVIVAELDKDLTRHPVHEIARLLAGVGAR